jgi:3-dehydroquinate synthase
MNSEPLTVSLGERSYDIFFGSRIYPMFQEWIFRSCPGRSVFVVTDRNVNSIYGDDIRTWLSGIPHQVLPLAPGEEGKTWTQLREIYSFLAKGKAGKDSLVVAFGGGVVGDMAGFAAASYLRGVEYVQIPTTLLAQVDASVGGKTGFNLPEGKNLVGAFHQPRSVFIDDTFLLTLDERNLRAGMAEVIKCALAGDKTLLTMLFDFRENWRTMSGTDRQAMVRRAVAFKAAVVEKDEKESSARRVLNLGHTVGHALEQATGYSRYLHGEAVGMGLAWELIFSRRRKATPAGLVDRVLDLLLAQGFFLDDPDVPLPSLASAIGMDKKRYLANLEMPMVTGEGEHILEKIPVSDLRRELPAIRDEIREFLHGRDGRTAAGEDAAVPGSIDILERRVVDNPRDLDAILTLAEAYRRTGNSSGAWEMIKEALHQYPSDARAQRAAHRIEQEFGSAFSPVTRTESLPLEDVVLLEEETFELRPADVDETGEGGGPSEDSFDEHTEPPVVRTITMADVYWKQGRERAALEIVRGILTVTPKDERALSWLAGHGASGGESPAAETGKHQDSVEPPVIGRLRSFLKTIAKEYGHVLSGNH